MAKLDELKQTFFDECDEALQQIEAGLTALRDGDESDETINAIFRAVHSVKGGAGIFGFEALVVFAHAFETVLDLIRHGKLAHDLQILDTMLAANDVLSDLIRLSRSGDEIPHEFGSDCRRRLDALADADIESNDESAPAEFDGLEFTPVMAGADADATPTHEYRLVFRPRSVNGQEIALLLQVAESMSCTGSFELQAGVDRLPAIDNFASNEAYLYWRATLYSEIDRSEVEVLLAPLKDYFVIEIEDIAATASSAVQMPALADTETPALQPEANPVPGAVNSAVEAAHADKAQAKKSTASSTTRIELEKIDRVVNLVGELVISQAMLGQIVSELPEQTSTQLAQTLQEVIHHTRELKDSVMSMRAQAVGAVFQRMPRLVRELSTKTGKKVRLELLGEKTEVDRSIIERLADPLTHIIRNAVDHGIETPEQRKAARKREEGAITLSAEHRGGRIVIQISDDGAGINSERVLQKAMERGLIKSNATLTDDEINNLIMLPGFSTAETISDISGRGVGMDVVRASITEIGGRVSLKSERGRGMTIQLSLPLTLAVMDGMVIKAAGEIYVMPLSAISECLLPDRSVVGNLLGTQGILQLRGEPVPLLKLAWLFSLRTEPNEDSDRVVIVTDSGDGQRIGLVVDELCGHQQVVIKSIEESYGTVPGIAAATILGNGRVAFILDVEKLAEIAADMPNPDAKQRQAA